LQWLEVKLGGASAAGLRRAARRNRAILLGKHENPAADWRSLVGHCRSEGAGPSDFTWKTLLCECETSEQAYQLREMLRRFGIDSWVEAPGVRLSIFTPRVVVAADQLERAIEIARQPIPQDIVDESREGMPQYELPHCPGCGTDDPVLESAEPTNSRLCERCGKQWSEPLTDGMGEPENAGQ
jgi:hypothetical protein